jgi:hypothetical protein
MKKTSKLVGGAALLLSLIGTADSARAMLIREKDRDKKWMFYPDGTMMLLKDNQPDAEEIGIYSS